MMAERWVSLALPALAASLATLTAACASGPRRFPLREPLWQDSDTRPVNVPCRKDPEKADHRLCTPEPYVSPFIWDGANNLVFRPLARFWAVDPSGEALNVNALDEVPDSSWFTNRIGRQPMTPAAVAAGSCDPAEVLDPDLPDGSWEIDQGKPNGANPGFRIRVNGVKYMLKADPADQPDRATGATAIASRLFFAAGWWAPCDSVVYFRPAILRLRPGLTATDNSGETRPFDQAALDAVLASASRRQGLVRMVASRWLPGRTIGPYRYEGTRDDDPNDVIDHEHRRDLRGSKLFSAWLNHFDSREQNSMDTWMAVDPKDADASPGYVRHWYIDLGDCFGSEWQWDGISRRLGHAYYFDVPYLAEDFVTFGLIPRPWDRARRSAEGDIFGYFHARDFDPDAWRGGYPNPAYNNATEHDLAWAARILARLEEPHVRAAIQVGRYLPQHEAFLTAQVLERRRIILRRYLARLSPITDLQVSDGTRLCALDLARRSGVFPDARWSYRARLYAGRSFTPLAAPAAASLAASDDGALCLALPHVASDAAAPEAAASRYLIVDLSNGHAEGVTRAHLYDLGPERGYQLVGVERPD